MAETSNSGQSPSTTTIRKEVPFPITDITKFVSIQLNGENYLVWKYQMTMILEALDLIKFVNGSSASPAAGSLEYNHWKKLDSYACSCINATLHQNIAHQAVGSKSAKDLWKTLEVLYLQQGVARRTFLRSQFQSISQGSLSVADYCDNIRKLSNELTAIGESVSDSDLILCTLKGLTPDFKFFMTIVQNSKPQPTFLELRSQLLDHEQQIARQQQRRGATLISAAELGDVPNIRDTVQILLDGVEEGQNRGNQLLPSIYMVPSVLRDISKSSFDPRVVAIGPLHREDKNVQEFQGKKMTYLHALLRRLGSPPEQTLIACVQKVNASIDRIRKCYAGMKTYTDIELATMMVMDCCFILEFLLKQSFLRNMLRDMCIAMDLVLLENQIPFFVLQDIFDCTISKLQSTPSLTTMLLRLANIIDRFHGNLNFNHVGANTTHDHILGLLHKLYHPAHVNPSGCLAPPTVHSATELNRAGVNFKPNRDVNWSMAMKYQPSWFICFYWFWDKPTLRMPKLLIDDKTEQVLRNFIAYEQSSDRVDYYFTSYAFAMDMLVDNQEDVAKLVESKVVFNN